MASIMVIRDEMKQEKMPVRFSGIRQRADGPVLSSEKGHRLARNWDGLKRGPRLPGSHLAA